MSGLNSSAHGSSPYVRVEASATAGATWPAGVQVAPAGLSSEQIAAILDCVRRGEGAKAIATRFGISHKTVRYHAKKADMQISRSSLEAAQNDRERMRQMRDAGMSAREIGQQFGLTKQQVNDRLRDYSKAGEKKARPVVRIKSLSTDSEAMRRCLCGCNRMFMSSGPGKRIRPECRRTWEDRL